MTESIPDSRWEEFYDSFSKAAELVVGFGPDPTLSGLLVDFIGDGDYTDALLFGVADVKRSDDRPRARQLAELLIPQAELLIQTYGGDRPIELDEFAETLGRLRTVVAAQASGNAVPSEFRSEFEAWWDSLAERGDFDGAMRQIEARSDASSPGECHWIHEILIGWLYSDDQWRWQAALLQLVRDRVPAVPAEIRFAAAFARLPQKQSFADKFRELADELESALAAE